MANLNSLSLPSPAKINHMLHILGRRSDGYHELQTVFQFLDWGDELRFTLSESPDIQFHQTSNHTIDPADNLITRAANLLKQNSPSAPGVSIELTKKIPLGSGLGGGSSNAATTLIALNHLWQLGLATDELADMAVTLGADVPIFVHGYASWAEGVGEKLTPINIQEQWVLLIIPPCHSNTAAVFSAEDLTRNTQPSTICDFLAHGGKNDCQPVACRLQPAIQTAMTWLNQHASAKMSGTGSAVFALFDEKSEAMKVRNQLPEEMKGIIAKGANRSPLYLSLDQF